MSRIYERRDSTGPGWTDERIETLERLWKEGKSASQIAALIGHVTRNGVIGKIHRLGLSNRPEPARPAKAPRSRPVTSAAPKPKPPAKPKPASTPKPAPAIILPPPPDETIVGVDMDHLGAGCKYPVNTWRKGHGGTARFCGAEREILAAYCPSHSLVAYRDKPSVKATPKPDFQRRAA